VKTATYLHSDDSEFLSVKEINAAIPQSRPPLDPVAAAQHRLQATGQWDATQFMGRRWPIGCVALEITQRCNLDCTACYLSENSEAVKDVPIEELFRRIDIIFAHYGPGTGIQVTGGDPTLRHCDELVAIVRRIADLGMQPALFTNGIRAKRQLLTRLADAGLVDVAFHVDLTQQRRGYETETALNAVRQDYIERARGLPIAVMFNTTVTSDNFDQIPDIIGFFVRNSDVVRLASFQLQADTGRGVLGTRASAITVSTLQKKIELGARTSLSFDTARIGHAHCNRYAMTFVTNGRVYDALDDVPFFKAILEASACRTIDRRSRAKAVQNGLGIILRSPRLWPAVIRWLWRKAWLAKYDLLASRGRINKLSFFIHNFMDACALKKERIDACSFMVATHTGPISMCLHNAKRDAFILAPLQIGSAAENRRWDPLTGNVATAANISTASHKRAARLTTETK